MSKTSDTAYDIFVKKLEGYLGKTFLREDILKFWLSAAGSKSRFDYGLSKAKNQGILRSLGGGIYTVSDPHISTPSSPGGDMERFDRQYWQIVALLLREHAPSGAIIAHEKSMELTLRNYEVPECLVLYTRDTAKRIKIGPYLFHFRTLKSGAKSKSKNMFRFFMDTSLSLDIENHTFHTLSLEASILDVASLKRKNTGISEDLIIRHMRKYEKSYDREMLGKLVSLRYIRAINRIRTIAKEHGFERLYTMTLDIIKKEGGGCYLSI